MTMKLEARSRASYVPGAGLEVWFHERAEWGGEPRNLTTASGVVALKFGGGVSFVNQQSNERIAAI